MKKLIVSLLIAIVTTNSFAVTTMSRGDPNRPHIVYGDPHTDSRQSRQDSRDAKIMAGTAIAVSIIGLFIAVRASDNIKGHIHLADLY